MANGYNYAHATTAQAGTILSPASCILHSVTINTPAAQTLTLYDGTSASGTVIAAITNLTTISPNALLYDVQCKNGLFLVSTGTGDITVTFG